MTTIDWNPNETKLRQFGWISLGGFGLIGVAIGFKFGLFAAQSWLIPGILWGIGVLSAILALVFPIGLRPLYWILTAISAVIGPVVSTIALGAIFLLIFTPVALFFKLTGRDVLRRKLDAGAASYWIKSPPTPDSKRYFRQF